MRRLPRNHPSPEVGVQRGNVIALRAAGEVGTNRAGARLGKCGRVALCVSAHHKQLVILRVLFVSLWKALRWEENSQLITGQYNIRISKHIGAGGGSTSATHMIHRKASANKPRSQHTGSWDVMLGIEVFSEEFLAYRKVLERLKVQDRKIYNRKIYYELSFTLEASCQPSYIYCYYRIAF